MRVRAIFAGSDGDSGGDTGGDDTGSDTVTTTEISTNPYGTEFATGQSITFVSLVEVSGIASGSTATIQVSYDDTDNDGLVDGTTVDETTLHLFVYDSVSLSIRRQNGRLGEKHQLQNQASAGIPPRKQSRFPE